MKMKKSGSGSGSNRGWFPKGHSGNRKGRPRTSRAPKVSVLEVLLDKTLTIGDRTVSAEEAIQQRIYQDALAGKAKAIRQVTKWIMKRLAYFAKEASSNPPCLVAAYHISPDPDNADEALQILGIARRDPDRDHIDADRAQLKLELWAAQAALRRRRGGQRLTDGERATIQRCTHDADSLRWARRPNE